MFVSQTNLVLQRPLELFQVIAGYLRVFNSALYKSSR
jgi:hypothetical protein